MQLRALATGGQAHAGDWRAHLHFNGQALTVGHGRGLQLIVAGRQRGAAVILAIPGKLQRAGGLRSRLHAADNLAGTVTDLDVDLLGCLGQINLPEAMKRVFGVEPGVRLRAEVTAGRIEIVKDIPSVTEGVLENGVLVLPRLGVKIDAGAAIRAERDELAERGARR